MNRKLAFILCLALFPALTAMAQEGGSEPKELSGISIVGNDDAPKSLYIVPWKSSEIGMETSLSRMLNEKEAPVDREVFRRELAYYQVSVENGTSVSQTALHQDAGSEMKGSVLSDHQYVGIAPRF